MVQLTQVQTMYMSKIEALNRILAEKEVNLWRLREMALSEGGLVNDSIRKRAWPLLVGLDNYDGYSDDEERNGVSSATKVLKESSLEKSFGTSADKSTSEVLPHLVSCPEAKYFDQAESKHIDAEDDRFDAQDEGEHSLHNSSSSSLVFVVTLCPDALQVERDVVRCTHHLLQAIYSQTQLSIKQERLLRRRQQALFVLLNKVLLESTSNGVDRYPLLHYDRLHYYQGYHEIGSILLSTLQRRSHKKDKNLSLATAVLRQISYSHLLDCLATDFTQLQAALRLTVFPLLAKLDPEVWQHFDDCQMEPFFCLSWVLTWFSRDLSETELVQRLFDCFLVGHALMPVYVSIAMVLHPIHRALVLNTDSGDFSSLHRRLRQLPLNCSEVARRQCHSREEEKTDFIISASDIDDDDYFFDQVKYVPIQEILDLAYEFMRQIPPRDLISHVAPQYYSEDEIRNIFSSSANRKHTPTNHEKNIVECDIHMLHERPAEWLLRATSCVTSNESVTSCLRNEQQITRSNLVNYSREKQLQTLPIIALGFGTGVIDERRRRRRRRKMLLFTVAASLVALFANTVFIFNAQFNGSRTSELESGVCVLEITFLPAFDSDNDVCLTF